MSLLFCFLLAVSLSMDAFSLALAYGTLNMSRFDRLRLSMIVGLYHFFMPLLGYYVGNTIFQYIKIDLDLLVCIILGMIGFGMISDSFHKKEEVKNMHLTELLFFGFAVSLDSFSVGIGLKAFTEDIFLSPFLFSITSAFFTYIGLYLGNKINTIIGKVATLLGGIVLLVIAIITLF